MRILVIGGTRYVGPHVVRGLVGLGHEVMLFHRGEHEPELLDGARHIHGDVADFERYLSALRSWARRWFST